MNFGLDDVLSVKECADFLGKDEKDVRQWLQTGMIPSKRSGYAFVTTKKAAQFFRDTNSHIFQQAATLSQ